MDWFQQLGNMAAFFQNAPALAYDMTFNGPRADTFAYRMAYSANATSAEFDPYPLESEIAFPSEEG